MKLIERERSMHCYISFCEKDAREVDVKLLIKKLKELTGESVQFLAYFERTLGDSLDTFMTEDLGTAHACLILLGPNYKERTMDPQEKKQAFIKNMILLFLGWKIRLALAGRL